MNEAKKYSKKLKKADINKWMKKNPNGNLTEEFGRRIAEVILDLKSSHAYFILQNACGELSWDEAERILKIVIENKIH